MTPSRIGENENLKKLFFGSFRANPFIEKPKKSCREYNLCSRPCHTKSPKGGREISNRNGRERKILCVKCVSVRVREIGKGVEQGFS